MNLVWNLWRSERGNLRFLVIPTVINGNGQDWVEEVCEGLSVAKF